MSFLKKLFGKQEATITSNKAFWEWFTTNQLKFYEVIKTGNNIEKHFFDPLSKKLNQLKEGYWYVTGMYDSNTAELILTADGEVKNIVFVEELVAQAPSLANWKFTALKPSLDIKDVSINMAGHSFTEDNLFFYSNDQEAYPDEIDISIVHADMTPQNKKEMTTGIYIFLDNYLGELNFVNSIDNMDIVIPSEAEKPLIPINKLKDFLIWREKEFIEKYEYTRYDTTDNQFTTIEATLKNKKPLFAVINSQMLSWDQKASHPWIALVTIKYDGSENNGLPSKDMHNTLCEIEEKIDMELTDKNGYLNAGRETADGERKFYFACREFRKPAKVMYAVQQTHADQFEMEYEIYKDKYWQTFERFRQ